MSSGNSGTATDPRRVLVSPSERVTKNGLRAGTREPLKFDTFRLTCTFYFLPCISFAEQLLFDNPENGV